MQNPLDPSSIKNIFWDVDGVLADLNHAYYHFLTGHPNYLDQFKDLKWEQLPEVLPILPEYGALELKTHPELGTEMDRDFVGSGLFRDRPLYPKVEVLKELNQLGYKSSLPCRRPLMSRQRLPTFRISFHPSSIS